jgi:alkanesulfonate monooxygenase SsuD/methylene tetrahydromethanopterin reductase-like flavin-dependent oxidoreductase (luciferase family)
MRLGVHLVSFSLPGGPETIGPTLAATGRAAEEAGLDNLSFMDHYLQLLMTGVAYRHPGLLAKILSTLDVLSLGRAALGIGAAWYEREHQALGVPSPELAAAPAAASPADHGRRRR